MPATHVLQGIERIAHTNLRSVKLRMETNEIISKYRISRDIIIASEYDSKYKNEIGIEYKIENESENENKNESENDIKKAKVSPETILFENNDSKAFNTSKDQQSGILLLPEHSYPTNLGEHSSGLRLKIGLLGLSFDPINNSDYPSDFNGGNMTSLNDEDKDVQYSIDDNIDVFLDQNDDNDIDNHKGDSVDCSIKYNNTNTLLYNYDVVMKKTGIFCTREPSLIDDLPNSFLIQESSQISNLEDEDVTKVTDRISDPNVEIIMNKNENKNNNTGRNENMKNNIIGDKKKIRENDNIFEKSTTVPLGIKGKTTEIKRKNILNSTRIVKERNRVHTIIPSDNRYGEKSIMKHIPPDGLKKEKNYKVYESVPISDMKNIS